MRPLTELSCDLDIGIRPEIVRCAKVYAPKMELSCTMDCWSLHFFHFNVEIRIMGQTLKVRPGMALLTPINTHTISFYPGGHALLYSHFMLPSSEGKVVAGAPLLVDMGKEYRIYSANFEALIRDFKVSPFKAEIGLWHLLLSLYGPRGEDTSSKVPGRLENAVAYIDHKLKSISDINEVAQQVEVSSRHLNRMFIDSFGMTVAGYIREKRMMQARDYLQNSDYLVKEISAMVGAGSQQHFNNMIRQRFGCSPLELRDNKE